MGFLKPSIFFFTFLLFQAVHAKNECQPQYCGSNPLPIRFPFSVLEGQQPEHCGHPDFVLTCSGQESRAGPGTPVLNLPDVGNFSVREINYLMQEIRLHDLNGCLPSKLINLSLSSSSSSSPFAPVYSQNFTFLSCPRGVATGLAAVECLSNSTAAVVATSSSDVARSMSGNCSTMFAVPVPMSRSESDWLSSDLSGDLRLSWSFPDCQGCESQGGVCGYDPNNSSSSQIVCYFDKNKGESRSLEIFKIIALSIVVPSIICSICISIFVCIMETRASRIRNAAIAAAPPSQPPPETPATVGLDEVTIESYKKVVLGESKRLPGPNGATCPICLVDYNPKDTLRCIPECQHCFHSDCVDEWLRLNSTCPVCRNSPMHPSAVRGNPPVHN